MSRVRSRAAVRMAYLIPSLVIGCYGSAFAEEFKAGATDVTVHGAVSFGSAFRTSNRDPQLLDFSDAATIGVFGNSLARNSDQGDLNYKKGQAVSTVLQGWTSIDANYKGTGVFVSAKTWIDFTQLYQNVPFGNWPNGIVPNTPLSDTGFSSRAKFSGVALQQGYVYGPADVGGQIVTYRLGYQNIPWGIKSSFYGGLSAINPVDIPALQRPGDMPEENNIPFPVLYLKTNPVKALTLDAFWQFGEARNAHDGCGTFRSRSDYSSDGCDFVAISPDDTASLVKNIQQGLLVNKVGTPSNNELDQGGASGKYKFESIGSEGGLYYAHYNSRSYLVQSQRDTNPMLGGIDHPFIPGDPFGGNSVYRMAYIPGQDMIGATWQTRLPTKTLFSAEYVYRPNYALQFAPGDILSAGLQAGGPLQARYNTLPQGAWFGSYDNRQVGAFNASIKQDAAGLLGSKASTWTAELGLRQVYDLPNPLVTRYLRSDGFGSGPFIGGSCPVELPQVHATGCTTRGYVSPFASTVKFGGSLTYDVPSVPGLDVTFHASYRYDMSGWSYDTIISEGANYADLRVRFDYKGSYWLEAYYDPIWGGDFYTGRDRSIAGFSVGAKF